MNKARSYNLSFHTWTLQSGTIKPGIGVSRVNGISLNHEIASFIEPNGIRLTQDLIDEINALNFETLVEADPLWGGNEEESAEIRNHPPRVVFNTGGTDVEVPVADFLQLLQEWKAFLETIPDPHWLSNR